MRTGACGAKSGRDVLAWQVLRCAVVTSNHTNAPILRRARMEVDTGTAPECDVACGILISIVSLPHAFLAPVKTQGRGAQTQVLSCSHDGLSCCQSRQSMQ